MARNPGRKSKAAEVEDEVEEQEEEQEEGGDGEEFEIEKIVQYKVDAFKDVRFSLSLYGVALLMVRSGSASRRGLQGQMEGV